MTNEVAKTKNNNEIGFNSYMTSGSIQKRINEIIGDEKRGARFVTAIVSAVNNNPQLKECRNDSILAGALLGESLNLSPSPQLGNYYLVPFNDKERGKVATFQLGWKGYYQLALRSGQYKKINVIEIKEGELISWNPLEEELKANIIEDDEKRAKLKTIGYYAFYENINGFRKCLYWSREKMENHANTYSQGYKAKKGYTFWEKNFDEMAKKTMLRQLISKYGVMSIDMQNAYESDMAVINEDGSKEYVDNEDVTPNTTVVDAEIVDTPNVSLDEV